MRILYVTAVATAMTAISAPALADGGAGARAGAPHPMAGPGIQNRWGPRVDGRWMGGARAPGGWTAYRRPVYGWVLPRYWINPTYYLGNYRVYGLPAPQAGFGWSRYYDDAVLTDRDGRVYDSRNGIDWDADTSDYGRDEGYAPRFRDERPAPRARDNGVGGAVIGGVVGGVAGNVIAGRGNRTVGTIVGAGVGAIAGAAIDRAEDRPRHAPPPPPPGAPMDYGSHGPDRYDDGVTYGSPVSRPGVGYDAPPRRSHWADGGYDRNDGPGPAPGSAPVVQTYTQPGYYSGGYYYPGATTTTVVIQPAVTTTTVEETRYVTRRVALPRRKTWRAAPKCHCK